MRWAVLVVVAACSASQATPDGPLTLPDAPVPDAPTIDAPPPDAPIVCVIDCFPAYLCHDGIVDHLTGAAYTCEDFPGTCPVTPDVYRCERGCGTGRDLLPAHFCSPRSTCEEARPKREGDPCTADEHCLPVFADVIPDGSLISRYLICGPDQTCVPSAPAAPVPDWLGPCSPAALAGLRGTHQSGVVPDVTCGSGTCLYSDDEECLRAACTQPCHGDHECPPGAMCRSDCPYIAVPSGWCKPGFEGYPSFGLSCVPEAVDAGP
jgi:hypothetical protein